jgi:hypothetical protein
MKKEFSFYEFTGTVIPGATLILGLAFAYHPLRDFLVGDKFGAGHLGLFFVASYIAGQLVQGIGNVLEKLLWAFRGMPSTWIRRSKPPYLSDAQTKRLRDVLGTLLGHEIGHLESLDVRACRGITGQLYAKMEELGRVQRIDIFNGNYGLFRGIASALLVVVAVMAIKHGFWTQSTAVMAGVFVVALMRMHRFGVYYASEMYRQALNLAEQPKTTIIQ